MCKKMHIITMTKQDAMHSLSPVPVDSAGAGAPGPIQLANHQGGDDPPCDILRSNHHESASEAMVAVRVGDRVLQIPEHVLSAGLSNLRLATGACAGIEDYAVGVGLVLWALERDFVVCLHA